jgi:transposase InsO family protein
LLYRIEVVLTDNDLIFSMLRAYYAQRQTRFPRCRRSFGIEHWLTSPHRPQTDGKVERFFRTLDEKMLIETRNSHWIFNRAISPAAQSDIAAAQQDAQQASPQQGAVHGLHHGTESQDSSQSSSQLTAVQALFSQLGQSLQTGHLAGAQQA